MLFKIYEIKFKIKVQLLRLIDKNNNIELKFEELSPQINYNETKYFILLKNTIYYTHTSEQF